MRKVLVAIVMSASTISPALAQTKEPAGQSRSQADCETSFKAADKDGNGILSEQEISDAGTTIPTTLAAQEAITMGQFVTACTASVPKGG